MTDKDRERKIARFMSRVNKTQTCWLWTWKLNAQGYGSFYLSNKYKGGAHRASYVLFKGDIPDGLLVCHSCDNPSCVNPEHLFLGTDEDNAQDCIRKGRTNFPKRLEYCQRGHKMTDDNILWRDTVQNGKRWPSRQCRTCKKITNSARYRRLKAAALAVEGKTK